MKPAGEDLEVDIGVGRVTLARSAVVGAADWTANTDRSWVRDWSPWGSGRAAGAVGTEIIQTEGM